MSAKDSGPDLLSFHLFLLLSCLSFPSLLSFSSFALRFIHGSCITLKSLRPTERNVLFPLPFSLRAYRRGMVCVALWFSSSGSSTHFSLRVRLAVQPSMNGARERVLFRTLAKNIACSKSSPQGLSLPFPVAQPLLMCFVHAEPLTVACRLTAYETARAEQSYANVCRVCTVRVWICTCGAFVRKRAEGEADFFQFLVNVSLSTSTCITIDSFSISRLSCSFINRSNTKWRLTFLYVQHNDLLLKVLIALDRSRNSYFVYVSLSRNILLQ